MVTWRALVRFPDGREQRIEIRPGLTMGRDPENACELSHLSVSAQHAQVVERNGRLYLRDLGSRNHTRILEGPSLGRDQEYPLENGTVASLGKVVIRFECDKEALVMDTKPRSGAGDSTQPRPPDCGATSPAPRAAEVVPGSPEGDFEAPTVPGPASRVGGSRPAPAPDEPKASDAFNMATRPAVKQPGIGASSNAPVSAPPPAAGASPPPPSESATSPREAQKVAPEGKADESGESPGFTKPIDSGSDALADKAFLAKARARLVVEDEALPRIVQVLMPDFVVGREVSREAEQVGQGCRLDHDRVSSPHARIVLAQNRFTLEDLKSTNGTYWGPERRKVEKQELRSEDPVTFGVISALFVADVDFAGNQVQRRNHERAARALRRSGRITKGQLESARREALEKKRHVGEVLILQRAVDSLTWAQEYANAALIPTDSNRVVWVALAIGLAVITFVLGMELFAR